MAQHAQQQAHMHIIRTCESQFMIAGVPTPKLKRRLLGVMNRVNAAVDELFRCVVSKKSMNN
jgi:hypothetical protein